MEPIWDWGNHLIVIIQTVRSPALDALFNIITLLGEAEFFLIIFPFVIWVVNKPVGVRLAYLVFISIAANTWAKMIVNHPRPFEWPTVDSSPVRKLNARATGPGLPSNHAQTSLVLWFYLAYRFKQIWLWLLAAFLVIVVSFSRMYLGVHFPTDLLAGFILGLIILLAFINLEPRLTFLISTQSLVIQIGLAFILPLILIVIAPYHDAVASLSTLSGFSLGVIFEQRNVNFQAAGPLSQRAARLVVGLILLIIFFEGFKYIIPSSEHILYYPLALGRYGLAGFWVSGGGPWVFKRLHLA